MELYVVVIAMVFFFFFFYNGSMSLYDFVDWLGSC